MTENINALILSAGTRNKVVQAFRAALADSGRVIAADLSPYAPALYDADAFHLTPRYTDDGYEQRLLEIIDREQISFVLSLIDPELEVLARLRDKLAEHGASAVVSDLDAVVRAHDKYAMYEYCVERGFNTIRSFATLDDADIEIAAGTLSFPLFVKPRWGSASIQVTKVPDQAMLTDLMQREPALLIQEFAPGQEYGVDAYVDLHSGEVVSLFAKKKLKMRAGETDKAVSVRDELLLDTVERFLTGSGYRGPLDLDVFADGEGGYLISEVNPRFGGGYPHAYACGVDFPSLIVNNLRGNTNPRQAPAYAEGHVMMKYSDIVMLPPDRA